MSNLWFSIPPIWRTQNPPIWRTLPIRTRRSTTTLNRRKELLSLMEPMRALPPDWQPSRPKMQELEEEFGHLIDLDRSLRRFRNHYSEGQTSRNWMGRFENWVLSDADRAAKDVAVGTDFMGIPLTQRKTSIVPPPAQPGDPDYFDPTEWFRSETEKEQP